ncbi:N-acetyl-1-D-myo-inositol-2-amino-2-deoxy-alpha-D-glucopyranoside deacetylase [Rhizohabitans arisaemae]|uniref:N-acetyl-1-D-myo-inositol-2-amino-2-deoxy-alpha- D-glucopyranoside deacetylase n=1 Tax=Rhizohabitans arisaemae TaxID=2720610 RepID=UPI0024B12BF9|nr:N-acetyl-1-D-myo-inositol-2-amino-2-deoxy-alpha-D-glucopyranoside deacetylase [Rhizohabitans arisaemae]
MSARTGDDRRLLLVHAHPDDESIGTGATMAKYAAEGAHVTLVTCTLGEEGEVIPPDLRHLAVDREDRLGEHRVGELAAACRALGVSDHRFLGGAGRWRDSGMMGLASNDRVDCFWQADVDEAAGELVRVIREVRPQVLVTYDANGFYGHPDHIQAHRVSRWARELAADPSFGTGEPWSIAKFYLTAVPRSELVASAGRLKRSGSAFALPPEDPGPGCADEAVTTEVDATGLLGAKLDALRAHATQVSVDAPWYALSDGVGQEALGREFYILAEGERGLADGVGRERDLFAGVPVVSG